MKVFVFEHLCSGCGGGDGLSPELVPMGGAMLSAVIADFQAMGATVSTMLDHRIALQLAGAQVTRVSSEAKGRVVFETLSHEADMTLVIAPESDGILEQWVENLASRGCGTFNSTLEATRLCSDKLLLSEALLGAGIVSPETKVYQGGGKGVFPCVVKPRWGAGSEWTFVCRSEADAEAIPKWQDWVVQPLVVGRSISCGVLVVDGRAWPLLPGSQLIEGGKRLHYRGGRLPLTGEGVVAARGLAAAAVEAVGGLNGFVGVDMVLHEGGTSRAGGGGEDGGSGGVASVIEVNARITMSYLGLRALCRENLASAMAGGVDLARLSWHDGVIRFNSQGQVQWESGSPTG